MVTIISEIDVDCLDSEAREIIKHLYSQRFFVYILSLGQPTVVVSQSAAADFPYQRCYSLHSKHALTAE